MKFYTVRDMRTTPKEIWEDLEKKEDVIITRNGRPASLMININEYEDLEELLRGIRQLKAKLAINSMRKKAESVGFMTEEEIEAEIAAARRGD